MFVNAIAILVKIGIIESWNNRRGAEKPLKNRHSIIPKIITVFDKIKIGIVEGCNKRGVSHIVELPFFNYRTGGET